MAQIPGLMDNALTQTGLPEILGETAREAVGLIAAAPGCAPLPEPLLQPPQPDRATGLIWRNWLFHGPWARRAHVEFLQQPGLFAVLHICLFPQLDDPSGIFGFDMLCGQNIATGAFLDISPVLADADWAGPQLVLAPALRASLGEPRPRPEWGDIFSAQFLALRPAGLRGARDVLELAITELADWLARPPLQSAPALQSMIARGQQCYVDGQKRNQHTTRMLTRLVGATAAQDFIEHFLFPDLPNPASATSLPGCLIDVD